jgi:peptidoglycan/xylan/chitin deacetylase (PgdA/CDA1 family)
MFHDIDEQTASEYFKYLKKHYNVIGLKTYLDAIRYRTTLPPKSLIITFDDGHIGNYQLSSLVRKEDIPITIFLCSDIVNTNRQYWFQYIKKYMSSDKLKNLSNKERIKALSELGFKQLKEHDVRSALNKAEIEEMKWDVDFQSHTRFHPCLNRCSQGEIWDEVSKSKSKLESDFELDIWAIAYPNGDYDDSVIKLTKKSGYLMGLTTEFGFNSLSSNLFELKRISTNDTDDLNEFAVRVSGLWGILKSVIRN